MTRYPGGEIFEGTNRDGACDKICAQILCLLKAFRCARGPEGSSRRGSTRCHTTAMRGGCTIVHTCHLRLSGSEWPRSWLAFKGRLGRSGGRCRRLQCSLKAWQKRRKPIKANLPVYQRVSMFMCFGSLGCRACIPCEGEGRRHAATCDIPELDGGYDVRRIHSRRPLLGPHLRSLVFTNLVFCRF
jgi:hypothetical protein